MGQPFIHLFSTSNGYYFYDVNTSQILPVSKDSYYFLKNMLGEEFDLPENYNDEVARNEINELITMGFLKEKRVKKSEHPASRLLKEYYNSFINTLILQVTQNCNLRCDYCIYSGTYHNRIHSNKRMSFVTAKKGIDYLFSHSKDSRDLNIAFYGGEPLLEFDLIHQCVTYISDRGYGRRFHFSITTNGTMLTEERMRFLVENSFSIIFSLDGPEDVHDSRRHATNNQGSFESLMNNIKYIHDTYPEYYRTHVSFNTVIDVTRSFKKIDEFISNNVLIKDSIFSASAINPNYSTEVNKVSDEYLKERRYEDFKVFLYKIGRLQESDISKIARYEFDSFLESRMNLVLNTRSELPDIFHHTGPCVPGAFRLFMTVEGDLYPCERVSEMSSFAQIGNINTGIDLESAERILNIEKFSSSKCRACWAYSFCNVCVACCDDTSYFSPKLQEEECNRIKIKSDEALKDYTVLNSLMYDS